MDEISLIFINALATLVLLLFDLKLSCYLDERWLPIFFYSNIKADFYRSIKEPLSIRSFLFSSDFLYFICFSFSLSFYKTLLEKEIYLGG
jgi:hypothetical protein